MLVLTFYHQARSIDYTIFKLYNKKYTRQLYGNIIKLEHQSHLSIFNSQNILLTEYHIKHLNNDIDYIQTLIKINFSNLNFDIIIHKIDCGGNNFNQICLLNNSLMNQLEQLKKYSPHQQIKDLTLAKVSLKIYSHVKHYACFDTGFHHSIELKNRLLNLNFHNLELGYKNFGSYGLIFEGLTKKLIDCTDKHKGNWIIINIDDNESVLCGVKRLKSKYCSASALHSEIPTIYQLNNTTNQDINEIINKSFYSSDNNIEVMLSSNITSIADLSTIPHINAKLAYEFYIDKICQQITKIGNLLQGIDGIIFSGSVGKLNVNIRQLICQKLEWLGISLSNKANSNNNSKLHKKLSTIQIFILNSSPEETMLTQFFERI